jgi:hypothetical protein
MKKQLFVAAISFFAPFLLAAQSEQGTVFSVQTQYLTHQLDSNERVALRALLREYHEKVTLKNEYVKSERTMYHFWTDDSRELITITEYADWGAIEKAGERAEALEAAAWPDASKRSEFMKKLFGYFTHHKDALYNSVPSLSK